MYTFENNKNDANDYIKYRTIFIYFISNFLQIKKSSKSCFFFLFTIEKVQVIINLGKNTSVMKFFMITRVYIYI